jgi:hypothetical protein
VSDEIPDMALEPRVPVAVSVNPSSVVTSAALIEVDPVAPEVAPVSVHPSVALIEREAVSVVVTLPKVIPTEPTEAFPEAGVTENPCPKYPCPKYAPSMIF